MNLDRRGEAQAGAGLLDLLAVSHSQIRAHARLALVLGVRSDLEAYEGAQQCLRFFGKTLPFHVRDEDESLSDRLLGRDARFDLELAQLHLEHRSHGPRVQALLELLDRVQASPGDVVLRGRLAVLAGSFETWFEAHLRREEAVFFPAIADRLSESEQAAVVRESNARRAH